MSRNMNASKLFAIGLVALMSAAPSAFAQSMLVKDSSFLGWTFGSYGSNGGSAVMAVTDAVGNPPPALVNTTTTGNGQTGAGYGIDTAVTTYMPLEGHSFTLKFDFESGPGAFGEGQGCGIAIAQGGGVYVDTATELTNTSTTWQQIGFVGMLNSADFVLESGSGPEHPDFTSFGIPKQFGFYAWNNQSGTLTNYYDNFSLVIK